MILSQTALARFLIEQPAAKRTHSLKLAAAWLIKTGQARRQQELLREVARLQSESGHLWAMVTTARPLSSTTRHHVEHFLKQQTGCKTFELETKVDPEVIGGILIETADRRLNATLAAKLRRFVQEATA